MTMNRGALMMDLQRGLLRAARMSALLIALLTWLGAARAWAGDAEDRARAEALFLEAQKLFDSGRIEAACGKFEQSLAIVKTSGALVNLARCHAAQGRTATAWREYKEGADLANKVGEKDRAQGARDLAAELEPRLSKLTITAPADAPEGLSVSRNGEAVDAADLGVAVPVDPGSYRIVARVPGKDAWETSVQVKPEGDSVVVEVALPSGPGKGGRPKGNADQPEPGPTAEPDTNREPGGGMSTLRVAGIAIGAVGAAVAIVGAVLGGLTMSDVNKAESDDALCGADKLCTTEGVAAIDAARTKGIAATALLAIGGAAAATGIVLIIIGGDAPTSEGAVTVMPTIGGAHVGVRFR